MHPLPPEEDPVRQEAAVRDMHADRGPVLLPRRGAARPPAEEDDDCWRGGEAGPLGEDVGGYLVKRRE